MRKIVSECCNAEIKRVSNLTAWFMKNFIETKLICPKCNNISKVQIKKIRDRKIFK